MNNKRFNIKVYTELRNWLIEYYPELADKYFTKVYVQNIDMEHWLYKHHKKLLEYFCEVRLRNKNYIKVLEEPNEKV